MSQLTAGFESLGEDINKVTGRTTGDTVEGVVSDYLPELTLTMNDEDIIKLTAKWKKSWNDSDIKTEFEKQADDNFKYWKGEHYTKLEIDQNGRSLQDNQIFQSIETFLPAASRQNPEPLVDLRSTEKKTDENLKYAEIIRNRLGDWADDVKIRLKIKKVARRWLISLVGVGKMSWDLVNDRPSVKILNPKKIILDANGITDEDGYSGKFVGEYRKLEAQEIIDIISKEKDSEDAVKKVTEESHEDLNTEIQFIEWWTPEYMCWTLDDVVLRKKKNPHWNYVEETTTSTTDEKTPEDSIDNPSSVGDTSVDNESAEQPNPPPEATPGDMAEGSTALAGGPALPNPATPSPMPALPTATQTPPAPKLTDKDRNHFPTRRMPYVFLSIFNMGDTPVDVTSIVTQNLPGQDLINKRLRQIDRNADGFNGGVVVSEEKSGLTKEEAKQVTDALRRGGTVVVPAGDAQEAVFRIPSVGLPPDVYNNMLDARNRMYDLFGTRGITPAGVKNEDTARGKILVKGLDTDRIGGGITEYLEQWCDDVYNWAVQLYYVYDDIFASAQGAKLPKIKVSVKEGSLLPKDATTKANQAIDLANGGKMATIDLYKALEYPDPEEMAANVWLEANAPEVLYKDDPRIKMVMESRQQQAQQQAQMEAQSKQGAAKGPSESINFKDLPPEGKAQMAKQAGIKLDPTSIVQHEVTSTATKKAIDTHAESLLAKTKIPARQNG